MTVYDRGFYRDRHERTEHAARTILSLVADVVPPIHSAVDLGCGVGTWLAVLAEAGARDILGLDGPWVAKDLLEIPPEAFIEADLTVPVEAGRRFDLAISLEVAEHLPPAAAGTLVDSLTGLSDFVLFSAAIPLQGGVGHVNEQWPDFWAALFLERGHVPWDAIRHRIWGDERIPVWYRQNVLLYVRRERVADLRDRALEVGELSASLSLVHPELVSGWVNDWHSVRGSARLLRSALRRWIGSRIGPD